MNSEMLNKAYDLKVAVAVKKRKIAEATEELQKAAGQYFRDVFSEFFDKYKIEKISWKQYTPYFNDGDECEFKTYIAAYNISINGLKKHDREKNDSLNEAYELISSTLKTFSDEDFLEYFGDHVQVTLTTTSLIVEKYEHE